MNQEEINAKWLHTCQSNAGECVVISPPVREVPGLRKPYQYEISASAGKLLVYDINQMFKDPGVAALYQCLLVESKPTKYGIRLNVFVLAYRLGLVVNPGKPDKGCSAHQWAILVGWVASRLSETLGPGVPLYAEPWSETDKFQARFETYIKYQEL